MADALLLSLLGGLLALDGTSFGQFMVSRPIVAGVISGWLMGDPVLGLMVGGVLEVYFIPVFPVGGSDFPEGGPPTLAAVAGAVAVTGAGGIAFGVALGLLLTRVSAFSIHLLREANDVLITDPSRGSVSSRRIVSGHLGAVGLDFLRGAIVSLLGLLAARGGGEILAGMWPLDLVPTLGLLFLGTCIPAGAFVDSQGGWRKRGTLFAAGAAVFLIGNILL